MIDKVQQFEKSIKGDIETLQSLKGSTMQYLQAAVARNGEVKLSVIDPEEWNQLQDTMQALQVRISKGIETLQKVHELVPKGYNSLCYAIPNVEAVKRDGDHKIMQAQLALSLNPRNRERDIETIPELIKLRQYWSMQYEQAVATKARLQPIKDAVDDLLKGCI